MSKRSRVHVQSFVRSPIFVHSCRLFRSFMTSVRSSVFRAFMSRPSCFHFQTFVRSCPDFLAFMNAPNFGAFMSIRSCIHVQSFVRSPIFCAFMSKLLFVHVQTSMHSSVFRAFMSRLYCVHVQTFVVHVQTFVRPCPEFCAFNRFSNDSYKIRRVVTDRTMRNSFKCTN